VGIVRWNVLKDVCRVVQQITVQAAGFSGAGDDAGPDIQAIGLLAMDAQFLEAFLQPLPVLLAGLLGEDGRLRVLLGVALEDAGGHEEGGVVYGVNQRFGVVEDKFTGGDGVFEPEHEVLSGWGGGLFLFRQYWQHFDWRRWYLHFGFR